MSISKERYNYGLQPARPVHAQTKINHNGAAVTAKRPGGVKGESSIDFMSAKQFEEINVGSFHATARDVSIVTIVELANRIVSSNEADEIDELSGFDRLISRLRAHGSRRVILNISKVTEIDVVALHHFLAAKLLMQRECESEIVLVGASSNDTGTAKLLDLFPHFETEEAAFNYLVLREPLPVS